MEITGDKTIIEVNGVKLEVDLRTAKRIDTLRVGDRVKVLTKEAYSTPAHKVYPGVVVGFEPFRALPTVIVAYLEFDWSKANMKFVYFNAETKDTEIIKAIDGDQLDVDKAGAIAMFDREIQKKRDELTDIERKREFFISEFRKYWEFAGVEA